MHAADTKAFTIKGTLNVPPGHCLQERKQLVARQEGHDWVEFEFETHETPPTAVDKMDQPSVCLESWPRQQRGSAPLSASTLIIDFDVSFVR